MRRHQNIHSSAGTIVKFPFSGGALLTTSVSFASGLSGPYFLSIQKDNYATISSPATDGTTVTSASLTVSGMAVGTVSTSGVYVTVNGQTDLASGTSSWTANVVLSSGSNTIQVYAIDTAGDISVVANRAVTYTLPPAAAAWDLIGFTKAIYGSFDGSYWPWIYHSSYGWGWVFQQPSHRGFWIYLFKSKITWAWLSPSHLPLFYDTEGKGIPKAGLFRLTLQGNQRLIYSEKTKRTMKEKIKAAFPFPVNPKEARNLPVRHGFTFQFRYDADKFIF